MKYILLSCLLFAGCGGDYHVKVDPIEPVKVEHVITLDTAKLEYYYRYNCQLKHPEYTTQQLNDCTKQAVSDFIDAFDYLK